MVSTTRGTLSRAAAEKAEGKKPVTEEGSGSRKSGSGIATTSSRMQLARLMMNPLPAYQKETIEFLSTLRVNFYEPDEIVPEGHGSGRFSFRINKRKYRMSFKELEDVFHFEHKDGRETEPGTPQAELQAFWAMIGVGEYMLALPRAHTSGTPCSDTSTRPSLTPSMEQRGDVSSQELPQLQGVCSLSQQSAQGKQWSAELWRTHNADPHELGITLEKPVDPQAINIQYLRKSTYLRGQPISGRHNYQFAYRQFEPGWRVSSCQTTLDLHHAGEGESSGDEENLMDYKTGEFHFKNHEIKGRKSAANTALESINTLKAWNQFQDKAIKSLLKTVKKMGKRIKQLTKGKSKSPSHDSDNTPPIHLGSYHDDDVVEDSEEGDEGSSKFQTAETSTRKRKASKSPQASTKG
ncbi:unnamed protein product [Microthlaspi erraticum]|uniref:Arabidopsis retrotransposon Orf1 C-terminal domain-containing protein n=1 Tax=Microthlaspi erraticum TaxID=1685480 RepID=A0A6D2L408_9BRAS|nr:unnamed protein product [Microthlaspi erraticum]